MGETERKREQQIREKKKQRETRREAQVECAAKVKMTQSAGQNRRTLWHPVTHTNTHTHTLCCSTKHTHTHRYTVAHGGTHKLWKMAASQLDSVLITLNLIFISGSASLFIFCAVVVVLPLSPSIPFLARSHNRTAACSPRNLSVPDFACCFCFLGCFFALLVAVACKAKKQRWLGAVSRLSPPPPSLTPAPPHGRHAVNILDKSFCPFGARSANKKTLIRCRCG